MITLWLKRIMLWLGLSLCGLALWQTRDLAVEAFARMNLSDWLSVTALLLLGWWLAVACWRFYLFAYTGKLPGWRTAIRQLGVVLIGKYVPGGVFGFLARMYDEPSVPRKPLFWAGFAEQAVGVSMPMVAGGVLYLAATHQSAALPILLLVLPPLAVLGILFLHFFSARLPWLRRHTLPNHPAWRQLLPATSLQLIQLLSWASLVALLSHRLHSLDGLASIGVAGAFLLGVAAGMIIMIVPGGIGVREAILIGLSSHWLGTSQAIFLAAFLRLLSSLLDVFAGILATLSGYRGKTNG